MNDYCTRAIAYIEKNYKEIIKSSDYLSISVGGSIARGYGNEHSDIDLICIGDNIEKYKKKFFNKDSYNIEVHEIPINYLENIIKQLSIYINFPNYDNRKINSIKLDDRAFGAKKCNMIDKKDNQLTVFLSNWRELKKITDSIKIYENSKFLTLFKNDLDKISLKESFIDLLILNNEFGNSDKIINLLKLNSFVNNDVFSKVLWIDLYLKKEYNFEISKIVFKKLFDSENSKKKFYKWYSENIKYIHKLHKKYECDICMGDMMQCNIMRCIHDYYNDTKKAKERGYVLGEFFSIQRVLMYIKLLYDKSNHKDVCLFELIEEFEFTNDEYCTINRIIRRNIDDKYKNG